MLVCYFGNWMSSLLEAVGNGGSEGRGLRRDWSLWLGLLGVGWQTNTV